ncbi:hypothetical protein SH449x_004940 [Pirellulaceae bacterium SH449]
MKKPAIFCALVFTTIMLSLLSSGCGKGPVARPDGVKVSGKAFLPNGSPLTGGTLIFRPEDGLFAVSALIQPDGTFTLQDSANIPSVVPGKYQVFVTFPNPNHTALRSAIPEMYQQSEDFDSDIVVTVTETIEDLVVRFKK